MNCHSFYNVRDLHAEGRLSARAARAAAAHLAGCAACRALAVPAPSLAPGARAPEALKAAIRASAGSTRASAPPAANEFPLWPREAYGVAAAAFALALFAFALGWAGAPSQAYAGAVAEEAAR